MVLHSAQASSNMVSLFSSFGPSPFSTFWMAGYECTDKLNAFGNRVDFLQVTGHLEKIEEDYENLKLFNIKTVREGIQWSQVEKKPYEYDWSSVARMMESSRVKGIQQVWDICHFGYPDDLTPLHPMFARRFAALCKAFVKFYRSVNPTGTLIVTPINEVSFISWLGGDACGTSPYCRRYGWEVKYALMKAYIEGIESIKEQDASVRILTTEPLVNIVPPRHATKKQQEEAARRNESQFQVLEILGGNMCPELRGRPEYLDMLGFNYYYNNQWQYHPHSYLGWRDAVPDPRWLPLSHLLTQAYKRYRRPLVLTETSHPREDRPLWTDMIARECAAVINRNVPLWGVCWYPIIDRPDWDHLRPWHHAGVWDIVKSKEGGLARTLHLPTATALLRAQEHIASVMESQAAKV